MDVELDRIKGGSATLDSIYCDGPVEFQFRLTNNTPWKVGGITTGYIIFSPDGASWQPITGQFLANSPLVKTFALGTNFYEGVFLYIYSATGSGFDTAGFSFYSSVDLKNFFLPGVTDVPNSIMTRVNCTETGKTICLDSTKYLPYGNWGWVLDNNEMPPDIYQPIWGGPYCFTITNCCNGYRDDVNGDGMFDIVDLSTMVDFLFRSRQY